MSVRIKKIIAVLNTKGGEGKTTLVINLAAALVRRGFRVLVVDTDPQKSLTNWYLSGEGECGFEVLASSVPSEIERLDELEGDYDFILVDGAATLTETTASAVFIADLVLIPIKASPLSFAATSAVLSCVEQRAKYGTLPVRFVFTMHKALTSLSATLRHTLEEMKYPYFTTRMTQREIYPRSLANGGHVFSDPSRSARVAAGEIDNICREMLEVISV